MKLLEMTFSGDIYVWGKLVYDRSIVLSYELFGFYKNGVFLVYTVEHVSFFILLV